MQSSCSIHRIIQEKQKESSVRVSTNRDKTPNDILCDLAVCVDVSMCAFMHVSIQNENEQIKKQNWNVRVSIEAYQNFVSNYHSRI